MSDSPQQIDQLLDYVFTYGPFWVYLVLFAACFVENLFPPFPGDTFIVAGGGLVAVHRLDMCATFAVIACGGLSSVMLLYWLGRRRGREYFIQKDFKYFTVADVRQIEYQFHRWGALILIASRFVVGMRAVLAIVAGIGCYPPGRMLAFSTVSYFLFAGLLMYLGAKVVENLNLIEYYFRTYNWIAWPIVIAIVLIVIGRKLRAVRRKERA
jgi:membrane protein DedA with SNARE-associated domain